MPRQLSSATTLDVLKKEAKRRLKALRAQGVVTTLRDVQLTLAREYGFAGWSALKARAEEFAAQRGLSSRAAALKALLRAANQGDVKAVAAVLDEQPDLIDERGTLEGHTGLRTALHHATAHFDVVKLLLERGANPNIRDEGDNAFPLHFVAERGDLPMIRLLVEHGAETVAGEVDDHELDIIGWATAFDYLKPNPEVVEYLLAHGARHTMFSAVATGDVEAIRRIAAASPGSIDKPMDRTNHRRRPLHLAVVKKQPAALDALLDLGADVEATDAAALTPLDQAALDGERVMAERLIARGAQLHVPAAAFLQRSADLDRLMREQPGCLKPGGRYGTLIVRAAGHGSAGALETLLAHGAEVNAFDDTSTSIDATSGYTPLHAAAWQGDLAAAAVLLRHGADPRIRETKYCGTPAGWADYNGKPECRDLILQSDRIDIFDAINLDRPDLIRPIVGRDPEALQRPFGAYATCDAEAAQLTPLAFATFTDKPHAVRVLGSLGAEFASGGLLARTPPDRAAAFLRMACLDWAIGGPERGRQAHAAQRLLDRHPEIARMALFTAVVCGDVEEVERVLAARPAAANAAGGPRGWPPLLYLCSARLPKPGAWSGNAPAIARLLLDHGADPNAYYEGGNPGIHYTALTCLSGRGEEQASVHPRVREIAALLLDRGAEPYDMQFLYNVFAGHASQRDLADDDFVWLLELIYQRAIALGRAADWQDPEWRMLSMGGYGHGAAYLLSSARKANVPRLGEWVLAHGGRSNPQDQPLDDIAALMAAAEQDRAEVVAAALDQGLSPDVEQPRNRTRLLHVAAYHDATRVVQLLIERGAEIDPRDTVHGSTPIYWAYWGRRSRSVDLLAPYSRDVWTLVPAGRMARLREVLRTEPRLATSRYEGGTPLFFLPDDERLAAEIVQLLLAHGADPRVKRADGATAADVARARGLDEAADLLSSME